MSLNNALTKELIEELERRNGFKKIKVEPYEKIEVGGFVVNGPAMVLINKYQVTLLYKNYTYGSKDVN